MAYKFQTGVARLEGATTFEDALVGESTISGAAGSFDAIDGTSLALQSGGITAAGAIAGATTIDASGDLTVGSITNAEFSVDSSGNTDIDGTLNVEGVPTFQAAAVFSNGITTAGAIAGASTISGSGLISGHALDIETSVSASTFWGDGAGITNINVENLDAAGSNTQIQFNQNGEFAGDSGLVYDGSGSLDLVEANASTIGLKLAGAVVKATAAELNLLDTAAAGTVVNSKAVVYGGAGQVIASSLSASGDISLAGASNIEGPGLELSIADLVQVDGITAGTAAASKAVVLDGSKNIATLGTVGCGAITSTGASTMGSLDVGGTLACDTSFTIDTVVLSATELGYVDGVTAGTAIASKAVVLDASKDVTGINILTASYFSGDGSGITNINVENLDAAGSDTQVQFNQNGEFAAAAGFTFDGTGSVASSVMVSSADLKATNLTAGRVLFAGTSGKLDDDAALRYDANGLGAGEILQVRTKGPVGTAYLSIAAVTGSIAVLNADESAQLARLGDDGVVSGSASGQFASLQIDSVQVFDASKNLTAAAVSGSGNFNIGGTLNADNLGTIADGDIDVTADLMIANDSATGAIKNMSLADYATKIAGAGLSATNGVLSTQAQSVSTDFNAGVDIAEGYNIYTGSANISVTLPTGSGLTAGDVFVVKQNASGEVTLSRSGTDTIDGESSILLESPYAAASLVYSGVDGQFRIV